MPLLPPHQDEISVLFVSRGLLDQGGPRGQWLRVRQMEGLPGPHSATPASADQSELSLRSDN